MAARRFAALAGVLYTLLGLLGFTTAHLFGLLHTYPAHNAIHLTAGIVGLAGAFLEELAWVYARLAGLLFLALAVLGVFFPDLFPAMPFGPGDGVLHFLTGAIALYIGYVVADESRQAASHVSGVKRKGRGAGRTRGMR